METINKPKSNRMVIVICTILVVSLGLNTYFGFTISSYRNKLIAIESKQDSTENVNRHQSDEIAKLSQDKEKMLQIDEKKTNQIEDLINQKYDCEDEKLTIKKSTLKNQVMPNIMALTNDSLLQRFYHESGYIDASSQKSH